MRDRGANSDGKIELAECFLSAGTSALLISVAHMHPNLWWFSLFALVPFLWRVIKATVAGSAFLGIILAFCFCFVAFPVEAAHAPGTFVVKLSSLSLTFALYAMLVNRIGKHFGVNAILIAALWLPLEYALVHLVGLTDILSVSGSNSSLVIRFGSLFGLLMVSFAIVLINSVTLAVIRFAQRRMLRSGDSAADSEICHRPPAKRTILVKPRYFLPCPRSPPCCGLE